MAKRINGYLRKIKHKNGHTSELVIEAIEVSSVAEIAVDLWRVHKRAIRDEAPHSVIMACENALHRLEHQMGFRFDTHENEQYNENMKVHVVAHEGGNVNLRVIECLSPSVYFKEIQVRGAEIVTRGDE